MRVSDAITKCVGFLYIESEQGARPVGTAFVVGVDDPTLPGRVWTYFVTARHVVEAARAHSPDGYLYLRLNRRGGGLAYFRSHVDYWLTHPEDLSADVAVWGFAPSSDDIEYLVYPHEAIATVSLLAQDDVGVGDEVFITGLFVNHAGSDRNLPIVRVGNIAAMPSEPISSPFGPANAYLIEARSIGGLSGSPVFVNLMGVRTLPGTLRIGGRHHVLLGLVHGHWDVQPTPATSEIAVDGLRDEVVNMGIAIVVPAEKILDIIDRHPAFVTQRGERREEGAPTATAATGG